MNRRDAERARFLLCDLGDTIREKLATARRAGLADTFAAVSGETAADTIYQVDRVSEEAILAWFEAKWPREWPVEVVMEGIDETEPLVFPRKTAVEAALYTCILDPIDGTRGLMYDKRSAWALAGLAPRQKQRPRLSDLAVAAMTELPPSKQSVTDQISGIAGAGREGILCRRRDPASGTVRDLALAPSRAVDFKHGFAGLVKFFPEGKSLAARIEEELWDRLCGLGATASPVVFDDQYISTGGQLYELLAGHDRMVADLRPGILKKAGFPASLVCHPYDICTGLLLVEAGGILEAPDGRPVDAPLDTTSPVAWIGYANPILAALARPVLQELVRQYL